MNKEHGRILRSSEVRDRTGLSRTEMWRREIEGEFPRRVQLGPNSVGWIESEVEAWIRSRPRATLGAKARAA